MSKAAIVSAGLIVSASFLLSACTVSTGPGGVDKDLLSAEVQARLTKQFGQQAPPVSCPDQLVAEVGKTTTCSMKTDEGTYDITVKATEVDFGEPGNFDNGNVSFDVDVADKPNP